MKYIVKRFVLDINLLSIITDDAGTERWCWHVINSSPESPDFGPKWDRLSSIWLGEPKCTYPDLKNPRVCPISGPLWPTLGPKSDIRDHVTSSAANPHNSNKLTLSIFHDRRSNTITALSDPSRCTHVCRLVSLGIDDSEKIRVVLITKGLDWGDSRQEKTLKDHIISIYF